MVGLHLSGISYIQLTVKFDLSPFGFPFAVVLMTYIMDDVLCNFPPKQQIVINNVRLFLNVNTLSEITDHTGRCVLDDFLLSPDSLSDIPLNRLGSTLLWPKQQCPGKQAWLWWKRAIRRLYCKTNSNSLRHPLGDWYPSTFNTDWIWWWVICPSSCRLYFWASPEGNRWHRYSPISTRHTYLIYSWDHPVVCPSPPPGYSWSLPLNPSTARIFMSLFPCHHSLVSLLLLQGQSTIPSFPICKIIVNHGSGIYGSTSVSMAQLILYSMLF